MPNNLSDAEIKKALECCQNQLDCVDCKCVDYCPQDINELNALALDLINRLQAENEKYKGIKEQLGVFWNLLLKLSIAKRKEKPTLEEFAEAIQEIKAESIKDFARELMLIPRITVRKDEIKRLLNEKVGEDDG